MHVARARAADLAVHVVVVLPRRGRPVPAIDHRHPVHVDAADERDLARLAGVDEPALLVRAAAWQVIPARLEARAPRREPGALLGVAREVLPAGRRRVELGLAPED